MGCLKKVVAAAISCTIFALSLTSLFIFQVKATETATLECVADAFVISNGGGSWNASDLQVGYMSGVSWRAFIMFDLSAIPLDAKITSARFEIKVDSFTTGLSNYEVSAYSAYSNWTEANLSWSNTYNTKRLLGTQNVTLLKEWCSWESQELVNALTEAMVNKENVTIALRSVIIAAENGIVFFSSRESGSVPRLVVSYWNDTEAPSISNIVMQPSEPSPNDEATLSLNATDKISGVKEVNLYYSNNSGQSWNRILMSSTGESYTGTIPRQVEGTTIQYYFEAFDNAGNRALSEQRSYTIKTSFPFEDYLLPLGVFAALAVLVSVAFIWNYKRRHSSKAEPKLGKTPPS